MAKINHVMQNKRNIMKEYTVLYSLKPFHVMLTIFGMRKFCCKGTNVYPVTSIFKLFSLICSILVVIGGSFSAWLTLNTKDVSEIVLVIYTTAIVLSLLTSATGILKSSFGSSEMISKLVSNIIDIDRRFKIQDKSIYIKSRLYIIIVMILLVVVNVGHIAYEDYCGSSGGLDRVLVWGENSVDFLSMLQLTDFSVFLWLNVSRMNVLNRKLKEILAEVTRLNEENECSEQIKLNDEEPEIFTITGSEGRNKLSTVKIQDISDKILFVMKIFDVIADNVQMINDCYGLILLFVSTTTFLTIMSTINGLIAFDTFQATNKNLTVYLVIFWCLPMTCFLLMAAYIAEMLRDEIDDTSVTIDKLTINPIINADHLELLECFSQMLTGRKVYVTANNFFSFDSSFIFSLVGTVATYTVILMQVNTVPPTPGYISLNSTNITSSMNMTNSTAA